MNDKEDTSGFVDRLLSNAQSLLKSAEHFFETGNIAHGTHFAILCVEECAKCLMYILRQLRPDLFDKDRYKHLPKYKTFGVFHFIAGALSIVHLIKVAKENGFLGGTEENYKEFEQLLLERVGVANLDGLARIAKQALDKADERDNAHTKKFHEKIEHYRKISVYCDFEKNGTIRDKAEIEEKFAREILHDAVYGVGLLRMVRDSSFSVEKIVAIWPSGLESLEESARDMVSYVLSGGAETPHEWQARRAKA